jgi:hypothetical protein
VIYLPFESFGKFFGVKEIERMLNENYRFDKEQVRQHIITTLNQKRFVNRAVANAVYMNVTSAQGDGVTPFSQIEWDRKRRKFGKWLSTDRGATS